MWTLVFQLFRIEAMGSEQSSAKIQRPTSLAVNTSRGLSPWLRLSNRQLLQIYNNVISSTTTSQSCDRFANVPLANRELTATCDKIAKCRYLDEALFHQCFALSNDVSSDLFKAFDREENGAVEWRPCLAGLTVCGDATLQQKCNLILSIFDLNERATINSEQLHNVMSIALLAAYRICQAAGGLPNEIHINAGAVVHDVLQESLLATGNQNGSISISNLTTLLEHNHTLKKTLNGLGIHGNRPKSTTLLMANSPVQKSPQLLRPIQNLNGSVNGIQHTYVWANVFPNHPSMPCTRNRHAACHDNNQIYIHGGRNGNTPLKDFWKYDFTRNVWTQLNCGGDTPPPLQEHTMAAYDGQLYLFGGEFGFRDADEIPLWIFNTAAKSWHKQEIKSEVKTPCGRRGHTAIISHDALHIYGGYVDLKGSVGELWTLDFESCWWHLSPDNPYVESPVARHSHSAVVYDNAMWIYGGINNLSPLKDLWKWDFATRQWTRIKFWSGPPALYGHTGVVSHDAMLIFGGQDGDGVIRNNLWKYHFGSQSWQKVISHKGMIPPPSTRHILLSVSSSSHQPDATTAVLEDPRPRSAPHPSRQRKVTPLLQISEQIQSMEIRPHSSPPCVTETDSTGKIHRKPFKNRVHPSSAAIEANIPSLVDSESDNSASDVTPLIPTVKEQDTSAIFSAMSPKRLFSPSRLVSTFSKNTPIERDSFNMQDVFSNPHAPDVLIVEDISDVSSLCSVPDEEECQPSFKECQPFVESHTSPNYQCNTSASSPSDSKQGALPQISVDPTRKLQHSHSNKICQTNETHQSDQKLSTNLFASAITSPMFNNLDKVNSKHCHTVIADKNLNYQSGQYFMQKNTLYPTGIEPTNSVGQNAETMSSMHPQESVYFEPNCHIRNENCFTDQNLGMQDQLGPHHKVIEVGMQPGQQSEQRQSATDQEVQKTMPDEQSLRNKKSSGNTNMAESEHQQGGVRRYSGANQGRQDGATRPRPKLHGRSKTEQALPLDRQAGGNHRQELGSPGYTTQEQCVSNMSTCLVLLGGQETTTSSLQHMTNPISMWKCHIIAGKPTKQEVKQLLSQ